MKENKQVESNDSRGNSRLVVDEHREKERSEIHAMIKGHTVGNVLNDVTWHLSQTVLFSLCFCHNHLHH